MKQLAGRKILFVITKSNWGGAQQYVYTLATEAKKAGADAVVALGGTGEAGAGTGLLAERLKEAGVRTIFLSSFARDIGMSRDLAALKELTHVLHTEKPDVLHLNSSKAGGIGALAGRIAHVPHIIFTAHGWPHKESRSFPSRAAIWLASYATVFLSKKVVVLSHKQYEESPALLLRDRLIVIPNGVGEFPLLSREEARAKLVALEPKLKPFTHIILSTSELHKNKGIDVLINTFERIAEHHPDTALILTHGGEERSALYAQVATLHLNDRIFFLGFVPEARSLLRAADIFVIPSRKEGLPFGLLEAGRAGIPVIASTVGAIPEVITNHVTGILIPSGNVLALTAAIKQLLEEPETAKKLGQALQKNIAENYSETRMVHDTFALYAR